MKAVKGLYTDCYERDQPAGTYRYAKNIITTNTTGGVENEPGFLQHAPEIPGDTIVGVVVMGEDFTVFSLDTDTGIGYIGYCSFTDTVLNYELVYSSIELNFSSEAVVKGEYQTNPKGERVVAWIEIGGDNPPRLINIDNPEATNINELNLFPAYSMATTTVEIIDSGGALLTGSYIPIFKYKKTDGTETNWIIGNNIAYINDDLVSESPEQQDGAPAGTPSGKAIRVTFSQVDTSYDEIQVGYIRSKGGIIEAFGIVDINAAEGATYTITGGESASDVSLDEVTTILGSYANAQAITQLNNQLILGNLTSDDIIDFQQYANQIYINYTRRIVSQGAMPKSGSRERSFQSGEVYAFYIILELKKGGQLAYHIPGRGPRSGERDTDTTTVPNLTAKKFQVSDTSATGVSSQVSNMAYWENTSERYPDDFPNGRGFTGGIEALANQPVRHHKFPDFDTIMTRHYPGNAIMGTINHVELGVSASNVNIPVEIQAQINGWKIAYAKRGYENSIVVGTDLVQLAASNTNNPSRIWTTGGNWHIKAIAGDGDASWQDLTIWYYTSDDKIVTVQRGHCLDLLYDRPAVTPSYAHFVYKLKCGELNDVYSGYGGRGGMLNRSGEGRGQSPGVVINYAGNTAIPTQLSSDKKTRILNFQYLNQNGESGNVSTKRSEDILVMELENLNTILATHGTDGIQDTIGSPNTNNGFPYFQTRSSGASAPSANFKVGGTPVIDAPVFPAGSDHESTYYTLYKQVLSDVYVSYTNQTLVLTSKRAGASTTSLSTIYGGDIKISPISYLTTAVQSPSVEDSENSSIEGPRIFRTFMGEARHNWGWRHEPTGAIEDLYFPKTDPRDFWSPRAANTGGTNLINTSTMRLNKLNYNPDYDLINEFVPAVIVSDVEDFSQTSPTTIIYSAAQSTEAIDTSWSTFPSGNRYTMNRNRGPITNLQGFQNRELIIHHRDSMFITQTNVGLSGDTTDINLKSQELFAIPPREVISIDSAYGGTQHSLAAKLTKAGYAFIDNSQGKVFLFNGEQLHDISSNGMRAFFRDNLIGVTTNNPFNTNGYNLNFDEKYNRILISKKAGEEASLTASYNPKDNTWISFHTYVPSYLFSTNSRLWSINNIQFFEHHAGPRGTFYSGAPTPWYYDVVFNEEPNLDKVLSSVSWISNAYNGTILQPDSTISHLTVWSEDKCTGRIPVSRLTRMGNLYTQNAREYNQEWYFNELYSISTAPGFILGFYNNFQVDVTKLNSNTPWYNRRKFIDKYVVCRFEGSNSDNYRLLLLETNVNVRQSPR